MTINHKIVNETLYLNLKGELDENAAPMTRDFLDALFEKSKMRKVVIDFSTLDFMDSTGIGVLLGRFKVLKAKGIPLYISNPSRAVDKILMLSGLYDLMPKIEF